MPKQLTIVWHTHEYGSTGYLVLSSQDLSDDFIATKVLDSAFEPELGETLDTETVPMVKVVTDGEVTSALVSGVLSYAEDRFACLAWSIDDVKKHRPEWADKQAREWLIQNSMQLQDRLSELGNQVIENLLPPEPLKPLVCDWASDENGYVIRLTRGDEVQGAWTTPIATVSGVPVKSAEEIAEIAQREAEICAKQFYAESVSRVKE